VTNWAPKYRLRQLRELRDRLNAAKRMVTERPYELGISPDKGSQEATLKSGG